MDEPLSNLDAKLRVSTRAQIKNLSHELQVTTIYVTHDQVEAMTLADRVVVMNKGIVQQVGTPMDIYDNPANTFVASFIGSPAMNLVKGVIADGVFSAGEMSITGFDNYEDAPVTLGFRAEDASVDAAAATNCLTVYSLELLGDSTMVTAKLGDGLVSIKASKDYRTKIGDQFKVTIDAATCHLFHAETGERMTKASITLEGL
jgi:multiple sugar transport system ATP-binding protein